MSEQLASELTVGVLQTLQDLIDKAPEESETSSPEKTFSVYRCDIYHCTKIPARYREEWQRPESETWQQNFIKLKDRLGNNGMMALIGPRGTGKTRLAAEAMRDLAKHTGFYVTAMDLFLRIRSTYSKKAAESEIEVVDSMVRSSLLIIDEIQERSESAWEDRLLTHIIDKRYGAMKPTIVIANLSKAELLQCLGESISSRLTETGAVMTIDGPSHRKQ